MCHHHCSNRQAMKVTRSGPVLVHAAGNAATADEHYYLSNLDQNVAVLMKTLHVFSPSGERPAAAGDDAARVIMDALGRVLVHYYPFEGSLVVDADGRLSVRNDSRGVPFVEADADCELKEVRVDVASAPDAAAVHRQLLYAHPQENVLQAPLLTAQVTRFRCGGFVLGLAMNHCLADGVAAAEFLRSWAETARGLPLSTPPFLDRTVLRARPSPAIAFPHEEFAEIDDVSGLADLYHGEPCVHRAFAIDAGKLARLKRQAADPDGDGPAECSTFVALTAFVWRATSRAVGMRPEQKSKLLFAVDGRRRVDPPLPPGFCGNAVVFGCCVEAAGDLLARPVSAAARSVQDAIKRTDHAFIRSAIDYIEVTRGRPSMTATTLVTAWNRLGFHSADFGWGEAAHSGPAELPNKEVVMFVRDHRGGMAVLLALPHSCMPSFQGMVDLL